MNISDFMENELYPALWERLDAAFPEFGFRMRGDHWQATEEAATRELPGAPRPDRVWAYRDAPFGAKIHGGEFIPWLIYMAGMQSPRGTDFIEAARTLAERAGLAFPEREMSLEELREAETQQRRADIFEAFIALCMQKLDSDEAAGALEYLASRGFTGEHIASFEFGLCPPVNEVIAALSPIGFGADEVREAGLAADSWPGRIVAPWRNRSGRIINIWARDLSGVAEPKYLMLRGGSKRCPYGMHLTRAKDLVLVEGFMDCLSLRAAGIENVIAAGGGQLSNDQISELESAQVKSVTLNYDYDGPGGAGDVNTLQTVERLASNSINVYVIAPVLMVNRTEEGAKSDPDEFIRTHGADAYRQLLQTAIRGAIYRAEAILNAHDLSSAPGKDAAVAEILAYDERLADPRDREAIRDLTAERTGYSAQVMGELAQTHFERKARQSLASSLSRTLLRTQRDLSGGIIPPEEALTSLSGEMQRLSASYTVADQPTPFDVDGLMQAVRQQSEGRRSGWDALDRIGVRFHPAELTVIGARTGHGKTTALLGLLLNWLKADTGRVMFFSYELPPEAVFLKLAAAISRRFGFGWTYYQIRDYLQDPGRRPSWPSTGELKATLEVLREFEERLEVVYRPGWAADQVAAYARRVSERSGPTAAVLVDYLQLVQPPAGKFDRRDIEVSQVARALKQMAVDLACPVVTAAQINRQAIASAPQIPGGDFSSAPVREAIRKRRPQLHHLREGGSEQEADLVLGLLNYRADYMEDASNGAPEALAEGRNLPGPLDICVLKNRYGPLGTATMMLEGPTGTIRDLLPGDDA